MFECELQLMDLPPNLHPLAQYAPLVEAALAEHDLKNPHKYFLRGGFLQKEDFDLLVAKGTDYHGRPMDGRHHPHSTYVATIDYIGCPVEMFDPLWSALQPHNRVPVLAVFDKSKFDKVNPWAGEHKFKHPRKKLEALLGMVHLKLK